MSTSHFKSDQPTAQAVHPQNIGNAATPFQVPSEMSATPKTEKSRESHTTNKPMLAPQENYTRQPPSFSGFDSTKSIFAQTKYEFKSTYGRKLAEEKGIPLASQSAMPPLPDRSSPVRSPYEANRTLQTSQNLS